MKTHMLLIITDELVLFIFEGVGGDPNGDKD